MRCISSGALSTTCTTSPSIAAVSTASVMVPSVSPRTALVAMPNIMALLTLFHRLSLYVSGSATYAATVAR